jgi:hypothetical protein
MRRLLPLLLFAGLALAGCRESLTGPLVPDDGADPVVPPFEEPTDQMRSIYVKAPLQMVEGQVRNARAEPLEDAAYYEWRFTGSAEVYTEYADPEGLNRVLNITAARAGTVNVSVRVYDAEREQIAVGAATFPVERR